MSLGVSQLVREAINLCMLHASNEGMEHEPDFDAVHKESDGDNSPFLIAASILFLLCTPGTSAFTAVLIKLCCKLRAFGGSVCIPLVDFLSSLTRHSATGDMKRSYFDGNDNAIYKS